MAFAAGHAEGVDRHGHEGREHREPEGARLLPLEGFARAEHQDDERVEHHELHADHQGLVESDLERNSLLLLVLHLLLLGTVVT